MTENISPDLQKAMNKMALDQGKKNIAKKKRTNALNASLTVSWQVLAIFAAVTLWYGIDDRLAAHFSIPAIGTLPCGAVIIIAAIINLLSWAE